MLLSSSSLLRLSLYRLNENILSIKQSSFSSLISSSFSSSSLSSLSSSSPTSPPVSLPPVGTIFRLSRSFSAKEVNQFAHLIRDYNPIHSSSSSLYSSPICHGWLSSSLFSSLFAQHFPGAVYVKQTVEFRRPVYIDQLIEAIVTVKSHSPRHRRMVDCETIIRSTENQQEIAVRGEATILIPNEPAKSSSTT